MYDWQVKLFSKEKLYHGGRLLPIISLCSRSLTEHQIHICHLSIWLFLVLHQGWLTIAEFFLPSTFSNNRVFYLFPSIESVLHSTMRHKSLLVQGFLMCKDGCAGRVDGLLMFVAPIGVCIQMFCNFDNTNKNYPPILFLQLIPQEKLLC